MLPAIDWRSDVTALPSNLGPDSKQTGNRACKHAAVFCFGLYIHQSITERGRFFSFC